MQRTQMVISKFSVFPCPKNVFGILPDDMHKQQKIRHLAMTDFLSSLKKLLLFFVFLAAIHTELGGS
jgi:hypothetical protein